VDRDGTVVYQHTPHRRPVLSREQTAEVAVVLQHVVRDGTARALGQPRGQALVAKTGTQEGNTDAWIVAASPRIAVAVWMGDPADPRDGMTGVPQFDVVAVHGGDYPARVAASFLGDVLAGRGVEPWPPVTIVREPRRLLLPGLECTAGTDDTVTVGLPSAPIGSAITAC
jgi:membrane peptidoglycan carboxypeptidase